MRGHPCDGVRWIKVRFIFDQPDDKPGFEESRKVGKFLMFRQIPKKCVIQEVSRVES